MKVELLDGDGAVCGAVYGAVGAEQLAFVNEALGRGFVGRQVAGQRTVRMESATVAAQVLAVQASSRR